MFHTQIRFLAPFYIEEDDVVAILNDKISGYTRYIMEAVKFVHENTVKRSTLEHIKE